MAGGREEQTDACRVRVWDQVQEQGGGRWRRALNPVSCVDLIALNESTQVTDVLADAAPAWFGPAMRQALRPMHKHLGRLKKYVRGLKKDAREIMVKLTSLEERAINTDKTCGQVCAAICFDL